MLTISPAARRVRVRRVTPLVLTTVALASLLAGCGTAKAHQSTSAPAGGGGTASGHHTQPPGAAGTGRPAASPVSSVNGLAVCQSGSLRVTVNTALAGAAAGSTYYPVDFTNTSGSACAMYGYPGVSFVTAGSGSGTQVGAAAQENPAFGKLAVRLDPGGVAHAWLQVGTAGNFPETACKPQTVEWLKVFPPDQTVAVYVNHSFDACASMGAPLLFVMPVRTGLGVRGIQP